jgi:hypothetical protein
MGSQYIRVLFEGVSIKYKPTPHPFIWQIAMRGVRFYAARGKEGVLGYLVKNEKNIS